MSDIEKKIVGYIIKKKVGKGGMATLYQGTQESLNRTVAIKELHSFLYDDSTFIERFKREALTLSKLEHPNIVRIYEFIEDKKTIYIIMEFVKGIDLKIVINKIEQKMPAQLAMMFIYYILKGLGYAHDKGIIHRDIKPGNILVSRNGEVKLVDFGLAHSEDAGNLTMTGTLMGTPAYMSPEQARGETADNQSDIFSTGIMFYELLTGKKPYPNEKNYMSIISKILSDKPLPIPQLEPSLDKDIIKIYTKMVEKDKGKRYKNCNDIISDIEEYFAKYGIRPSEQLLKKYLISPSDFFIEYKKSQIEKGLKAGKEKFKEGREGYSYALTHFKNVLLWDTENAEAMGGIDKINAELSKGKISPFPIVLIALAAVALILYFTVFRITTTLSIDSNPSGAIVVLDESKLEKVTPISINVKPGTHSLAISKELYEDKNISIEIEKGEKKTLSYDLVRWNYQLATFDISPKNVPIFIDGKKVDGKKVKIPIGNHKILAKKDGFSTYEKNIQVFEGGLKSYKIVLRKIEDIFTIESNPPNATIYIDNNNAGKTPAIIKLKFGDHNIKLILKGYNTLEKRITFSDAKNKLFLELSKKVIKYATCYFPTKGGFATVYIDGKKIGFTPIKPQRLIVGSHKLKVRSDGFQDITEEIRVSEGENKFPITLKSKFGYLKIVCKPWANAYLDGQKIGITPMKKQKIQIGKHILVLKNPKCKSYKETIIVESGKTLNINKQLLFKE